MEIINLLMNMGIDESLASQISLFCAARGLTLYDWFLLSNYELYHSFPSLDQSVQSDLDCAKIISKII